MVRALPLLGLLTASALVAAGVTVAQDALGCGGGPDGAVHETLPMSGDTWPANAAIHIEGITVFSSGLTATVDGQPATLVDIPELSSVHELWLSISPQPAAGAEVVIQGEACASLGSNCTVDLSFTAGPADETAPPAPLSMRFDLKEVEGLHSPDCEGLHYGSYFAVRTTEPVDSNEEAPNLYVTEVFTDSSLGDLVGRHVDLAGPEGETKLFLHFSSGGPDACVRVTSRDAAGNVASPPITTCKAC